MAKKSKKKTPRPEAAPARIEAAKPPALPGLRVGARLVPYSAAAGLVAAGALVLGLVCIFQFSRGPYWNHPMTDEEVFVDWALRIAAGEWIGRDVFYFDPLFPYTLAFLFRLFGETLLVVRILQAALAAGAVFLVFLAGKKIAGERAGLAAALILALYGPMYFFELLILKESMVIFLAAAASALAASAAGRPARRGQWAVLGVILALITLLRGNFLAILPLAVIGAYLSDQKPPRAPRLLRAAILAAGMGLVIFPVTLRNYLIGGEFVLTTSQAGPNFYIGNNPLARGRYAELPFVRPSPWFEVVDFKAEAEKRMGRDLTPREVSRFWFGEGFRWIGSEPGKALKVTLHKARLMVHQFEIEDNYSFRVMRNVFVPALFAAPLGFGALWGPALVGLYAVIRRRETAAWLAAVILIVYPASIIPFFIVDRYRLAVVPALALFAAAGAADALRNFRDSNWKILGPELAAIAAALAIGLLPIEESAEPLGLDYISIAMAYQYAVDGDLDQAEYWYQRALADLPPGYNAEREKIAAHRQKIQQAREILAQARASEDAEQLTRFGQQLEDLKNYGLAARLYERAMTLDRELIRPRARLGIMYCDLFEMRDPDKGLELLTQVLAQTPQSADAMSAIAKCHYQDHNRQAAREWVSKALAADPANQPAAELLNLLDPAKSGK